MPHFLHAEPFLKNETDVSPKLTLENKPDAKADDCPHVPAEPATPASNEYSKRPEEIPTFAGESAPAIALEQLAYEEQEEEPTPPEADVENPGGHPPVFEPPAPPPAGSLPPVPETIVARPMFGSQPLKGFEPVAKEPVPPPQPILREKRARGWHGTR